MRWAWLSWAAKDSPGGGQGGGNLSGNSEKPRTTRGGCATLQIMKHFFILTICAFLTACGGGGGGGVPNIRIADDETITRVLQEVDILKTEASTSRLTAAGLSGFISKVEILESDINNLRQNLAAANAQQRLNALLATMAALRRELKSLLAELPPLPTIADCIRENKILDGEECRSCTGEKPLRRENECHTASGCALLGGFPANGECRECRGATPYRIGNQCSANPPSEYQRNYALGKMNAAYAYERGYFGQGVTVAVVGTGVRATHEELAANVITMSLPSTLPSRLTDENGSHETWVAGIIGAVRNNMRGHGVAPSVKLVPFHTAAGLQLDYVNDFHVINKSFGIDLNFHIGNLNGVRYRSPFVPHRFSYRYHDFQAELWARSSYIGEGIHVWAAGNHGWQGRDANIALLRCTNQNTGEDCDPSDIPEENIIMTTTIGKFLDGFTDETHGQLSTLKLSTLNISAVAISAIAVETHMLYPYFQPSLENHWLAVIALNQNDEIAKFSNGCGAAKEWCIAAHGVSHYTTGGGADDNYVVVREGTSFSAPHVSGALAVLKSAIPGMSMPAVRAILLTTARDLGETGIDEIYGRGLVDIEAGIRFIENLKTPPLAGRAAVPLSRLRGQLPAGFGHLQPRLQKAEIAIKMGEGWYYNMPLSKLLSAGQNNAANLGNAADEMLSENNNVAGGGKFGVLQAFGNSKEKIGLRWQGNLFNSTFHNSAYSGFRRGAKNNGVRGLNVIAEISHAPRRAGFFGASFGALGAAQTKTNGGKIQFRGSPVNGAELFGEYGYNALRANTNGGFITEFRGAKTDEWKAGVEFLDMWKTGGKLRFSAAQKPLLGGGEMVLQYPHALGDSFTGFKKGDQTLELKELRVPLKQKSSIIYSAGYIFGAGKSRWSAAAEYDAGNNQAALSAKWRKEF